MTEAHPTPQIFICYAHNDNNSPEESKRWLDRLQEHLAPLELQGKVEIWSDQEIELGEKWHERIQETLQQVRVAILLVSPAFLVSKYIRNSELPVLLKNAKDKGVVILPILLRQCFWKETTFKYPDPKTGPEKLSLSKIQIPTTKPLNGLTEYEQDEVLYQVTQRIYRIVEEKSKVEEKSDESNSEVQQQESGKQASSSNDKERQPIGENLPGTNIGNYAPNVQGSTVISGQSVQGNTFIGTQHNYSQPSEQERKTEAETTGEKMTSEVDIGIIVALREEFRELFPRLPSPQAFKDEETGVTDYLFKWGNTVTYRCAATFVGGMGTERAALATERFIKRRQPKTVVMLGIAGGIDKDVKLGDVVVVSTANNYLHRGRAVTGGDGTFTFEPSGDPYRCSDDLVRAVQDLEFAHHQLYQEWQEEAKKRRETDLSSELLQKEWLRVKPVYLDGAIASGSVVGSSKPFIDWLKQNNRNYLAIEMEGAGMLSAVYSHADPKKTLILRGISDFADERKQELDRIGKGGIRRYAMNNAIALLWKLLEAQILPKNEVHSQEKPKQTSSSNQVDLLSLKQTLRSLTISDLNDLIDVLNVPSGQIPPSEADQASRVDKLLNWAKSPRGCELKKVQDALDRILNP